MVVSYPTDMTVIATSASGAVVNYPKATLDWNTNILPGASSQIRYSIPSGSLFPVGVTPVVIRFTVDSARDADRIITEYFTNGQFSVTVVPAVSQTCPAAVVPIPPEGFTQIATFRTGALTNIAAPISLVEGCDGRFYGLTSRLPSTVSPGHTEMTLISLSKDGLTASVLFRFISGGVYGFPQPELVRVREALSAGSGEKDVFYMANDAYILRYDTEFPGVITPVHQFIYGQLISSTYEGDVLDAAATRNGMLVDLGGNVIGVSQGGGAYSTIYGESLGAAFRFSKLGSDYTILRSIPPHLPLPRVWPNGRPALLHTATGTQLWVPIDELDNNTYYGNQGGYLGKMDADGGRFEVRHQFRGPLDGPPDVGRQQSEDTHLRGGLLAAANGNLYGAHGIVSHYLPANTNATGYFFCFYPATEILAPVATLSSNQTPALNTLVEGRNGWIYTYLLGKTNGHQTLFAFQSDTHQTLVAHDFANGDLIAADFDSEIPPIYWHPAGALVAGSDGAIYGTAPNASGSNGVFFRYVRPGTTLAGTDEKVTSKESATDAGASQASAPANAVGDGTVFQSSQLTVPTNFSGDNVGRGLALGNNLMLAGVPFGGESNFPGAVHVFRRTDSNWNLESTLRPPTNDDARLFGFSVAFDKDTAVVGAPGDDSSSALAGSAYVFQQQGTNWSQQARLHGDAGQLGDVFGTSVAIDGDSLLVGAPQFTNAGGKTGAAFVFQRTNAIWTQQAMLLTPGTNQSDLFGISSAICGTNALVGAPRSEGFTQTFKPGKVCLFTLSDTSWTFVTNLTAGADSYADDLFGISLGAGDGFYVVGAPGRNPLDSGDPLGNRRAVFIFSNRVQIAQLHPAANVPLEMFGASLSVDGTRITVGAPRAIVTNSAQGIGGASYVFDLRGTKWFQNARLAPSDPQPGDHFGFTVGAASNWVGVSSIMHSNANALLGSAYVFNVVPVIAPTLRFTTTGPGLRLDWTEGFETFVLEYNTDLNTPDWFPVTPAPVTNLMDIDLTPPLQFFRLRQP